MKTVRTSLTIILLIYSIPAFLSGIDIYKGTEPDLSSEWIIVSIYFLLSFAFILVNLFEILKLKKIINLA